MNKMIKNIMVICLLFSSLLGCKCKNVEERPYGVWWWDDSLEDKYFDFVKDNEINEIYYCNDDFDDNTSNFIGKAKENNIRVYWLAGEYKWLNDPSNLYEKIDQYIEYQDSHSNKFWGIHLDIEPHQDPNFDNDRDILITRLIELASELKVKYPNIKFDYDIPFWLDDEIIFNEVKKNAYKHMIDIANRIFIMSYRDTSEEIYEVSKDEIEYAHSEGKVLVLGVETKSNESDKVSFEEEGKEYMYGEIYDLWNKLPSGFGITIHHVKSWYDLKDK